MNDEQLLRYNRHIMLPDIDIDGQEKLLAARVLIIGMGGLGSPVALYLAAAGVGELVINDFDEVDLSNLQRQIAHRTIDIGRPKVESARDQIAAINDHTRVTTVHRRLEVDEITDLAREADVVVDCSDNFPTRFKINDACFRAGTPLVSGAAVQLEGQVSVFDPRDDASPCYRCLYHREDDTALTCAENGIAAPVVGMIGTIQAMETMKVIMGMGKTLTGHLLVLDAKHMDWHKLKIPRNPRCAFCQTERN